MPRNSFVKCFGLFAFICIISILSIWGCSDNDSEGNFNESWDKIRAQRLAVLDAYLEENQEAFESFRTAPLGIKQKVLNFIGSQMIVFRLLPEIFPEIWGLPEEKLAVVGLGPDPFDPDSVLPLGVGFTLSQTFDTDFGTDIAINYVNFTCMGCHSGKVVGPDGELINLFAAPNPLGDYTSRINETVNDPKYTAENFRNALNGMPVGWVYGFDPKFREQEILERDLFNLPGGAEFFLEEVKIASNLLQNRLSETLYAFTYNIPNPPLAFGMPGSLDVFGFAGASQCNPNGDPPCEPQVVLPQAPSPADIPAVWKMSGRPRFQWDDSITSLIYREVFASLSVSGSDPDAVNMDNVVLSAPFTEGLPAYPYPFQVNLLSAARGALVFVQACGACHASGNNVVRTPDFTGTSPNRAFAITDAITEGLIEQARQACDVPECLGPNGQPVSDDEILDPTKSYIQIPLVGVWATAPYLHNGSVPTLYHLITGDRPDTFYRGNYTYDQDFVGFTWDKATIPSGLARLYDTSLDGYSNAGHTGPEFNGGIDWEAEPEKLRDLLEYLKTL
jgi:RoxA-like, cytochrome c-like